MTPRAGDVWDCADGDIVLVLWANSKEVQFVQIACGLGYDDVGCAFTVEADGIYFDKRRMRKGEVRRITSGGSKR